MHERHTTVAFVYFNELYKAHSSCGITAKPTSLYEASLMPDVWSFMYTKKNRTFLNYATLQNLDEECEFIKESIRPQNHFIEPNTKNRYNLQERLVNR